MCEIFENHEELKKLIQGLGLKEDKSELLLSSILLFYKNFTDDYDGSDGCDVSCKKVLETIINKLPVDINGKFTEKSLEILSVRNIFDQNFLNLAVEKDEYEEVLEIIINKNLVMKNIYKKLMENFLNNIKNNYLDYLLYLNYWKNLKKIKLH